MLAAASPLAGDERGNGGERTEGACAVVVVGDHVQHRGVVPALRRREAGPRLEDGVEAGQRSKGAGRAVAGDRHVHQPRVQARQVIPADPEPVHDTRAEVLDDDVGAADEVEEYLVARCALQVEHQRALAAVPADEAEELEAERIAARRLDLDDVGTQLGEQQRTERTRDEIAEVEDTDPLEAGARSVAGRSVRRARRRRRLGQDRRRIGARDRRRARPRRGCVGEDRGRGRLPRRPEHGIVDGNGEAQRARFRITQKVGACADAPAWYVGRAQRRDPRGRRACGEDRLELAADERAHVGAVERHRIALESRMREQVHAVERGEELRPERLREGADEEPAVGRRIEPVARIDAAWIAARGERPAVAGAGHERAAVERERGGEAAHLDRLAGRTAPAGQDRGAHAERGQDAGHVADHRRDEPDGPARPRPLQRLRAPRRREQRLVRRQADSRPSPCRHPAADEFRIRRRHGLVRQHPVDPHEERALGPRVE